MKKRASRARFGMAGALAAGTAALLVGCTGPLWVPPPPSPWEIPSLEARLQAVPGDTVTAIRLAHGYREAGRGEEARTILEELVRSEPPPPSAALLLGTVYEELGLYGEARRLYNDYLDFATSVHLRREVWRRLPLLQRQELRSQVRDALEEEARLADTPPTPGTVAVLPFHFVGIDPELRPLGRALAEMLVTDLARTGRIRVLERSQVQYLLDELELVGAGVADPATAARTGRILGVERAVQGSLDGGDPTLRLESAIARIPGGPIGMEERGRLERTPAGEVEMIRLSESSTLERFFELQTRLALRIHETMGIQLTPAERERVTQRPTENLMAILAYGRGLEAEDQGRFATAAEHYAEAVRLDPGFQEAREAEERARWLEDTGDTPPGRLALLLEDELPSSRPVLAQPFFPVPLLRDPGVEVLGSEGLAPTTLLEIILRSP